MNLINRFLISIQLLFAIALAPILIVVLLFLKPTLVSWLDNAGKALSVGPNALLIQTVCVSMAIVVFVIAVLLLFLELQRPSANRLKVQQIADAQVEVTTEAIVHRLQQNILLIPDIVKVKPRVMAAKGNSVDLLLDVETGVEVNVPQKTQEVITLARQIMEEKMGLKVGKVQVKVDHAKEKK